MNEKEEEFFVKDAIEKMKPKEKNNNLKMEIIEKETGWVDIRRPLTAVPPIPK
jgi:hypothetical protein